MSIIDKTDPGFECAVSYDAAVPCVSMIWKGHAISAEFRNANERVLSVIKEHDASKVLCDARDFILIGPDDQHWLASDWIPRALQAGMRKCALVMPRFYFNRVAIQTVSQRLDGEFSRNLVAIQYFETRSSARTWLSEW